MSITVTVMYPNETGSKFDMDYYLQVHGPLVENKWGDMGMTSLKVIKGIATPDPNTPPPYQVVAILGFESLASFQVAVATNGDAVMGDIPNFTDVSPIIQISDNLV